VITADVDLRNRRAADAILEHGADLPAAVIGLVSHRIEIHTLVLDTQPGEQLAH
jgi:hypothetical protein